MQGTIRTTLTEVFNLSRVDGLPERVIADGKSREDAAFIAQARTALPAALNFIELLVSELDAESSQVARALLNHWNYGDPLPTPEQVREWRGGSK